MVTSKIDKRGGGPNIVLGRTLESSFLILKTMIFHKITI